MARARGQPEPGAGTDSEPSADSYGRLWSWAPWPSWAWASRPSLRSSSLLRRRCWERRWSGGQGHAARRAPRSSRRRWSGARRPPRSSRSGRCRSRPSRDRGRRPPSRRLARGRNLDRRGPGPMRCRPCGRPRPPPYRPLRPPPRPRAPRRVPPPLPQSRRRPPRPPRRRSGPFRLSPGYPRSRYRDPPGRRPRRRLRRRHPPRHLPRRPHPPRPFRRRRRLPAAPRPAPPRPRRRAAPARRAPCPRSGPVSWEWASRCPSMATEAPAGRPRGASGSGTSRRVSARGRL